MEAEHISLEKGETSTQTTHFFGFQPLDFGGCTRIPSLKVTAKAPENAQNERVVFQSYIFGCKIAVCFREGTLQGTNISHLGERKIIFKSAHFRVSFSEDRKVAGPCSNQCAIWDIWLCQSHPCVCFWRAHYSKWLSKNIDSHNIHNKNKSKTKTTTRHRGSKCNFSSLYEEASKWNDAHFAFVVYNGSSG